MDGRTPRKLYSVKSFTMFVVIFLFIVLFLTIIFFQKRQDIRQRAAGSNADITVDFGSRLNTSHPITHDIFGLNGFSKNSTDQVILNALAPSHITLVRVSINMGGTFPTASSLSDASQQNWTNFDSLMSAIQSQGLHPILTIGYVPPWLEPTNGSCSATGGNLNPTHVMPTYIVNGQDTGVQTYGQLAALVVAHMDQKFSTVHPEYEIWNEPDGTAFMCPNTYPSNYNNYKAIFAAAAPLMKQQSQKDGVTIHVGGPTIAVPSRANNWIGALLNDPATAPYVDFVSYHYYVLAKGTSNWTGVLAGLHDPQTGHEPTFQHISALVRAGKQPNALHTPIYLDEYNIGGTASDCCRESTTYGSLWHAVMISDLLNSVNDTTSPDGPAQAPIAGLAYFTSTQPPGTNQLCLFGVWDSAMDCSLTGTIQPYPPYYPFQMLADPKYLDITNNGYMTTAPRVNPSGLIVSGFYTRTKENVFIVNTSATAYPTLTVALQNTGTLNSTNASLYTLNQASPQIGTQQTTIQSASNGYTALVNIPAYSTVALSLSVTPLSITPSPTSQITPSNSPTPMHSITPSPTQSISNTPTPTINPNNTIISVTVCLHGLGNCGDNVSQTGGNIHPLHPSRAITISVFDTQNNPVGQSTRGGISYVPSSANFQGSIDMKNLPTGNYLIKIKSDGFLERQIPQILHIISSQTNVIPEISLIAGDINNDNQLDIQDYNILVSCFGTKLNSPSCPQQYQPNSLTPGADILDDDKLVDGADYNELIREFSVQQGQ